MECPESVLMSCICIIFSYSKQGSLAQLNIQTCIEFYQAAISLLAVQIGKLNFPLPSNPIQNLFVFRPSI